MTRRIALISEHASPLAILGGVDSGGQNVYVGQIARHLAAMGYEVDVFTRRDAEFLPETAEWVNGVRIVYVPAGPAAFVRKEDLLRWMDDFTSFVMRFIKRQHKPYDIIHANFFMSGLVAANIKKAMGIPFVVTFHALGRVRRQYQGDADEFPQDRFEIEDRIVAEADRILAECPQDEEDLIRLYNADPAQGVESNDERDPQRLLQFAGDQSRHPEVGVDDVVGFPLALAEPDHEAGKIRHEREHVLLADELGGARRDVDDANPPDPLGDLGQACAVAAGEDVDLVAEAGQVLG